MCAHAFQPQRDETRKTNDKSEQNEDRFPRKIKRRAPDGLINPRRQIPGTRQDGAKAISERIHTQTREANSHEAKGRRRQQRADADGARRRLEKQRKQNSEELARQNKKQSSNVQQPAPALQGQLKNAEQNRTRHIEPNKKHDSIRKHLARYRRPQSAAKPAENSQPVACFDVYSDRIGRRRNHNDLQHAL